MDEVALDLWDPMVDADEDEQFVVAPEGDVPDGGAAHPADQLDDAAYAQLPFERRALGFMHAELKVDTDLLGKHDLVCCEDRAECTGAGGPLTASRCVSW